MGMIFNTPTTLRLIEAVNTALTGSNFTSIVNNKPPSFVNLQNLGPDNGFYENVWRALNIDECGVSIRLQFWWGLVDTFKQTYNGTEDYLSGWIGKAIYEAISNHGNFAGVEFFAVPGSLKNIRLALPFTRFSNSNNGGKLTQVITIYTDIVDNFPGAPPRTGHPPRRPPPAPKLRRKSSAALDE